MASLNQRVRRDTFIWAAILAGHGLLLVIMLRLENQAQRSNPDVAAARSFIWLSLSQPVAGRLINKQRTPAIPQPLRRAQEPESLIEVQPMAAPKAAPRVDWLHEGVVSAAAIAKAEAAAASKPSTFSPPPRKMRQPCQPKESSMKWKEPRVGMAGAEGGLHLPYMVLGKRCVIGLGFFGCNLGDLPEVNGHLLDDMHDPNRSRSSVPAIDSCD